MKALLLLAIPLALMLILLAIRAWMNHQEIQRMRRNGCRRQAFRRSYRGCADPEFLRGMAEACLLVLLLIALFGWFGLRDPRW